MEKITHPITKEGQEYLNSIDEESKKLHEMAQKKLGSSYFVERTNGFRVWLSKKREASAKVAPTPELQLQGAK